MGTESTTDLFVQELKDFGATSNSNLQVNCKVGGGLIVEGFRTLSVIEINALCRKYGKQFFIRFADSHKTISVTFETIPEFFTKKTHSAPLLSRHSVSSSEAIESTLNTIDRLLGLTNGILTHKTSTRSCILINIKADSITSETSRAIQCTNTVVSTTILPTHIEIVLMKENDSRTSLAFLKEHRPEVFTCISKKPKSIASKHSTRRNLTRKQVPRKRNRGFRLWPLS